MHFEFIENEREQNDDFRFVFTRRKSISENIFPRVRGEAVKRKHRLERTMHKLIRGEAQVLRGAGALIRCPRGIEKDATVNTWYAGMLRRR